MTKVCATVDTSLVMYPSKESESMPIEEAERIAVDGFLQMYYQIYEDLEEIQND